MIKPFPSRQRREALSMGLINSVQWTIGDNNKCGCECGCHCNEREEEEGRKPDWE